MFPRIPTAIRVKFAVTLLVIGVCAAAIAYSLQDGSFEISALAAGFLAAALAFAQWVVAQLRESTKTIWEAVKSYYAERDTKDLLEASAAIHTESGSDLHASTYCNFYEKWGRLAELGYLPVELFKGASGVNITNALLRMKPFLLKRRESNPHYASSYVWLVSEIRRKGYLPELDNDSDLSRLLEEMHAG